MSGAMVQLTLPDGKVLEVESGTTLAEVAAQIGPGLAKAAIAAELDGRQRDLAHVVRENGAVRFFTSRDAEALYILRHSTAHLMAQAVLRRFPEAKFGVGPPIEHGFYYDMLLSRPLTGDDLEAIEQEMKACAREDHEIVRMEKSREEALAWASERGDEFKQELIGDIAADDVISFYRQGDFTDLCVGVHVPRTSRLEHFKLLSVAGSYWRGDEKRAPMQRIYGTAFFDKKGLKTHLEWLEEVKKRDHRKLGKDLDLFFFHQWAPASPFFQPKGARLYNRLVEFARELYVEYDYQEVVTPQIFHSDLWRTSGHYEHYKEDMFFIDAIDGEYGVKPMNCPGHMLLFGSKVRSYRELPLRIADFGRLHRYEASGAVRGLTRVRSFAQDDAHIFLDAESIGEELDRNFDMLRKMYSSLGIDFPAIALGTRPESAVGDPELWRRAEDILRDALEQRGEDYELREGDGAFYGPKIDFAVKDALGREWQLPTFQLDFNLPDRFDLKYSAADGSLGRPVVIHRAMLGSLERFFGVYLEHTAGNFPLWVAPVQVKVLTVSQQVNEYAEGVAQELEGAGVLVERDFSGAKIGAKIRESTLAKIPYLLVLGGREAESNQVAVRKRGVGDEGAVPRAEFAARVLREIRERALS